MVVVVVLPLPRNHIALVQRVATLVDFHNLHQLGGDHTSVLVREVLERSTHLEKGLLKLHLVVTTAVAVVEVKANGRCPTETVRRLLVSLVDKEEQL
tara:strand:- start:21 stop:311 length:291 start_codon:yes stop_codon:yes gene_type:complete